MTNNAFTLAEVLITLGIIGIVAALTIPNLLAKYNRMVTANRLAKVYSTISNGIKLSENDNGPMKEWPNGAEMEMESYWNTYWKPYFIGAELCANTDECGFPRSFNNHKWVGDANWTVSSGNSRILFRLVDGTIVFLPRNTTALNPDGSLRPAYVNLLVIDINGPKLPNESGKDTFMFMRNTNSGITPYSGGDCKTSPIYCAELIMQNNWKIPDDYPWIK